MKKIGKALLTVFLASSCMSGFGSCGLLSEGATSSLDAGNSPEVKNLKVLTIGNSHSTDTMMYVEAIANDLGMTIDVTSLYIGGSTIEQHYQNALVDAAAYDLITYTISSWKTEKNGCKITEFIQAENWDYIMIQTATTASGFPETYSHLGKYLEILKDWAPETAKFIWNIGWAYSQDNTSPEFYKYSYSQEKMYTTTVDTVKKLVAPRPDIAAVVASATAIQNARTSFVGDTLCHDGVHLGPYGRYIVGMTWVKTITGVSIDNISYMPEIMDARKKAVAIESANNAVKTPFAVTPSEYKDEN